MDDVLGSRGGRCRAAFLVALTTAGQMVEFSVRIDFYRDLEGPKDYVGSALRDGLTAV